MGVSYPLRVDIYIFLISSCFALWELTFWMPVWELWKGAVGVGFGILSAF